MKHINELNKEELQQALVNSSNNQAVLSVLGNKKQLKIENQYHSALWSRLQEIDPVKSNIDEDQLLAELFN